MQTIAGTSSTQSSTSTSNNSGGVNSLTTDDFLKLMLAQLQNQDPLNPADNTQMLQQVSEIRNIGATDKLTTTLNSVLLGQNLTSATSLIGKQITALSDADKKVTGVVDHVTVAGGTPKVHVGDATISLKNISDIQVADSKKS